MAKGEKGTAKIARARALADEELRDARAKAERKIKKARATLRADELKIQARLGKAVAKVERKRAGKRLSPASGTREDHDPR
jgi:F0F1-type ATP synthase membrane subunit b/b'